MAGSGGTDRPSALCSRPGRPWGWPRRGTMRQEGDGSLHASCRPPPARAFSVISDASEEAGGTPALPASPPEEDPDTFAPAGHDSI